MKGGLRPPILKFSFQVGDVWFCGFYPALPLNGESDLEGYVREGVKSGHQTAHSSDIHSVGWINEWMTVGDWHQSSTLQFIHYFSAFRSALKNDPGTTQTLQLVYNIYYSTQRLSGGGEG